jgi:DNA-binding transcriptional regulator/RsmH inhibitor MraZ
MVPNRYFVMGSTYMDVPLDDDAFQKGFCWGLDEITVDQGPRIRLPAAVVRTLAQHKVKGLWLYPDPTGPGLIICPDPSREQYIKLAKRHLPSSMKPADAYRTFVCAGESVRFRNHGRISITTAFHQRLKVARGEQVVIIGTGLWYEVWRQEDWPANEERQTSPS